MQQFTKVVVIALLPMFATFFSSPNQIGAQEVCWGCEDNIENPSHWLTWDGNGWESEPGGIHFTPDSGWCLFNHDAGCFPEEDQEPETEELLAQVAVATSDGLKQLLVAHGKRIRLSGDGESVGFLDCAGRLGFWYTLRESQVVDPLR